jgi:branched-chain amino acid transport system substrate-binding protein
VSGVRRAAALIVAVGLLAGGCGSRASEDEIRTGAGASTTVTLDQASVDQLRAAAEAGRVAGGTTAAQTTGAPLAPGTTQGPGTSAQSGPSGAGPGTATGAGPTSPGTTGGPAAAAPAGCASAGAPLSLGQIGSFGGVFGPITANARTALAVWAKYMNSKGGLACHPVNVWAVDDGADPSRGSALIGQLVSEHQIQALVATVSLALPGMMGAVEKSKLPLVGGDMVSPQWHSHPQLFPQGGGLEAIINGAVRQAVESKHLKHGLLYCVESSICTMVAQLLPARAKAQGAEVVYSSPVSLTQTDFTAQCQNAKNAGVDAFGMAIDGSGIARVARSCAALGYYPLFVTSAAIVSSAQAKDPGIRRNTLSTATGNAPWFLTDTPGGKEFATVYARYAPGVEPDGPSMVAWSAAKLFEAAIARLGDGARSTPITTATIFTGLGKIKNDTLGGLAPPITFSPGQKAAPATDCVFFELLTDKGWTANRGSTPVCTKGSS